MKMINVIIILGRHMVVNVGRVISNHKFLPSESASVLIMLDVEQCCYLLENCHTNRDNLDVKQCCYLLQNVIQMGTISFNPVTVI